ncbi:MAG: NAD(P)/FAD-dependent oxidoreductase, partial [Actinomycetota bacterium]
MQLRRAGLDDFVLYEKQPDVGGTWLRNTYPGLHCDIPSHLYCYSFEPNPDWRTVYAAGGEIQRYLRACAERYDLIDHIRFSSCVEAAHFDESAGSWALTLDDGTTAEHRVLVAATGGITEPHLPRLDGLDSFAGRWWHSGAWQHDFDLAGRHVAVVGSAASAVQVVPAVADRAARVTVFSRTPNWIVPRNNAPYTEADRRRRTRRHSASERKRR